MKKVAGSLKSEMAQFASLATFAQFGTEDLDAVTKRQLERGARLTEILKQDENSPLPYENQVCIIYIANSGGFDDVPVEDVRRYEPILSLSGGEEGLAVIKNVISKEIIF